MSPLLIKDVTVGESSHVVGIFGCTLSTPLPVSTLLEQAETIATSHKIVLQLINADQVAGASHLLFATIHALTAFHHGTQRSASLGMEILRFTAAQRQISKALQLMGVTDSTQHLAGILVNTSAAILQQVYDEFRNVTGCQDVPTVLDLASEQKEKAIKKAFKVSVQELQATTLSNRGEDRRLALQKIVYERCALLAITR